MLAVWCCKGYDYFCFMLAVRVMTVVAVRVMTTFVLCLLYDVVRVMTTFVLCLLYVL